MVNVDGTKKYGLGQKKYINLSSMETLLFYLIYCIFLCVQYFRKFPLSPVSRPIPNFYANILANIPCYLGFYTQYRMWCTGRSLCG